MPELPEVETIVRQLDLALKNRRIVNIDVFRDRSFVGNSSLLIGKKVSGVNRRAKMIEFDFFNWDKVLMGHLKMTGQLVLLDGKKRLVGGHPTADWVKELPSKHTRVMISFEDGASLFFNDMRVFGWLKIVDDDWWQKEKKKMPPDVVDKEFSEDYFTTILKRSGRAVKLVLMDQTKIGGIGNIYANDALYLASIRPDRKANTLTKKEVCDLFVAVKEVINKGIKYGGASASDDKYVNAAGLGGGYQNHFLVYQCVGKKCEKCGGEIRKMKLGGRGTFFCDNCQK